VRRAEGALKKGGFYGEVDELEWIEWVGNPLQILEKVLLPLVHVNLCLNEILGGLWKKNISKDSGIL
jgi:hypothetical protein